MRLLRARAASTEGSLMLFTPENADKVMSGRKTRTTRVSIPPWLEEGKVVAVQPGRGKHGIGHMQITKIRRLSFYQFLKEVERDPQFAKKEGRPNGPSFVMHLLQLAGKENTWKLIRKNEHVYVLDFKVVEVKK